MHHPHLTHNRISTKATSYPETPPIMRIERPQNQTPHPNLDTKKPNKTNRFSRRQLRQKTAKTHATKRH